MAPKGNESELTIVKKEIEEIKASISKIQLDFMRNMTSLSGSVQNIEQMMKSGFSFGKEECFNHRTNIGKELDRQAETLEKHAERIGEMERRSAAVQVIIGIVSALLTALITTVAIKLIQ
jgi:ElaB/YqjD/DUF883 family membrane-anchored ribosome-binding protein